MKKIFKFILPFCFISIGLLMGFIMFYDNHDNTYNDKNLVVKNNRSLSMMLETESGTGVYELATRSTWPSEGYVFNSSLSKCENGSKITWNETNATITYHGNKTDKCYIYFDKYTLATINSLTEEATSNSITVTLAATQGTKAITKYYYSSDNGTNYIESTSNTHTYTGLKGATTYNIKAYAVDEKGKSSEVYTKSVKTSTPTLAEYVKSQYTGTQGENSIYLHNGTIKSGDTVIDAGDNSYRYAGGDYVLTEKAINAGIKAIITNNSVGANDLINFYCNKTKKYVGSYCDASQNKYYTLKYDSSNTQYQTSKKAFTKAITDGYITSDNVKNFVCFGSDATMCPTDNLYRIIGVFGSQVKLIKADYATSTHLGTNGEYSTEIFSASDYAIYQLHGNLTTINRYSWENDDAYANVWANTALNTVNLNQNYINYLNNQNSKWTNMIMTTTWKVGGNTYANIFESPMYIVYQKEIISPAESTTYNAKIGLMYGSDYGYAASSIFWIYPNFNSNKVDYSILINDNWMYIGLDEWTITRDSGSSSFVFNVNNGQLFNIASYNNRLIRPTFYLNSNVLYDKGSGTSSDPIRIKL